MHNGKNSGGLKFPSKQLSTLHGREDRSPESRVVETGGPVSSQLSSLYKNPKTFTEEKGLKPAISVIKLDVVKKTPF